jgi:glycine cleavage system H protein
MTQVFFTDDHEYIRVDGSLGTVGITDYAQKALGDVVYVELPKVGAKIQKGAQAGVVESVKSASEIYAPVSGEVTEVNQPVADDPARVNADAEGGAWFFKVKISNASELTGLKDADAYKAYTQGL